MPAIKVKAKISGYHPSTGLFLEEGQEYTIEEEAFSEEIFEKQHVTDSE